MCGCVPTKPAGSEDKYTEKGSNKLQAPEKPVEATPVKSVALESPKPPTVAQSVILSPLPPQAEDPSAPKEAPNHMVQSTLHLQTNPHPYQSILQALHE